MKLSNNFIAFILTNRDLKSQKTIKTLRRAGYTGKICFIIDTDSEFIDEFYSKYKSDPLIEIVIFDKLKMRKFDLGDNFDSKKGIIYARNVCFDVAKNLGYKYFIQLDDDYTEFSFKFDEKYQYKDINVKNLDKVLEIMLEFYINTPITTVAMAQGGDFIGGKNSGLSDAIKTKRKAMNTFICSTDRPFDFVGRINEDVNSYVTHGKRGLIFLTITNLSMNQTTTQSNKGGMTDIYEESGTYYKSFYSVMYEPSCVKIATMGSRNRRIHHRISWNNAVPKILAETVKIQKSR